MATPQEKLQKYRQRLEREAKDLKVQFGNATTNSELLALVEKKRAEKSGSGSKPPAVIEGKATEVKSEPTKTQPSALHTPQTVVGGYPVQMAFNIAPPQVQYQFPQGPAWWQIADNIKDAALYMVAGAALYAVLASRLF